jgi:threonine dehydratase
LTEHRDESSLDVTRDAVALAAERIAGHVRLTPVLEVSGADLGVDAGRLVLKLEHTQKSGSFKARGAFNRILQARERHELTAAGVITASGGNAGLAVAMAGRELGIPAEIHVPATAPVVKLRALRDLGAHVVLTEGQYADAFAAAVARQQETSALLVHPYDQVDVCAGQGTLALELIAQAGPVDTVLVAVGGGGLLAGIAAALEGTAQVVGVEPDTIPTLRAALDAGEPVDVAVSGVAADSLGARRLGTLAYDVAVRTGVRSVLVPDASLVTARQVMWSRCRLLVEHAAAAPLAALASGAYAATPSERVALILCGGNTDPEQMG